jgi:hypothetical protein
MTEDVAEQVEQHYLVWDTCQIATDQAKFLQEEDPSLSEEEAFRSACEDIDLYSFEWSDLCDTLTVLMDEINSDGVWDAEVSNFGWRSLNGHKKGIRATTGIELLGVILPKTDCTFKIYKRDGEIAINNAHHDSPTWAEWYYVRPAKDEEEGVR